MQQLLALHRIVAMRDVGCGLDQVRKALAEDSLAMDATYKGQMRAPWHRKVVTAPSAASNDRRGLVCRPALS